MVECQHDSLITGVRFPYRLPDEKDSTSMSAVENYDGLCGTIHLLASSDKQVRCSYEFGHHGPHSWDNKIIGINFHARLPGSASSWFEKYCK
jgi:hypothetical protein